MTAAHAGAKSEREYVNANGEGRAVQEAVVKYRDAATRETWSGRGRMPNWLRESRKLAWILKSTLSSETRIALRATGDLHHRGRLTSTSKSATRQSARAQVREAAIPALFAFTSRGYFLPLHDVILAAGVLRLAGVFEHPDGQF
jgi:H-NS histone family